jgi:poly-gamma-glutamate synthesis protein (capsule biosynthesis protein)
MPTGRGDLTLMYFPIFDATSGELRELRMTPMQLRKLRLNRAAPEDAMWLRDRLARISLEFRSQVEASDDGSLRLRWH